MDNHWITVLPEFKINLSTLSAERVVELGTENVYGTLYVECDMQHFEMPFSVTTVLSRSTLQLLDETRLGESLIAMINVYCNAMGKNLKCRAVELPAYLGFSGARVGELFELNPPAPKRRFNLFRRGGRLLPFLPA